MTKPLFKVDFNEMVSKDIVLLSISNEKKAENGRIVSLKEGLEVDLFEEDINDDGEPDNLIASGVVIRTPAESWDTSAIWSCRIDKNGIRHEIDNKRSIDI